jgi:uncharacterized membrane protein
MQFFLRKINKNRKNHIGFVNMHGKIALLLVAILFSAYFLSQQGFINYVTGGAIHSRTFDYHRMETSSDPLTQISFYSTYTPTQDVFSAVWLSKYSTASSIVYSDLSSLIFVLTSKGLVPGLLEFPLTSNIYALQGSFVYLSSVSVAKGVISNATGYFNASEISSSLQRSDLVYSNGNSTIWSVAELG